MADFYYKVYRQESETLLAIADSRIIGKTLEDREKGIQIDVSPSFYQDKSCDESRALELIRSATIVNAVGKDIISLMIKDKLVNTKSVLVIEGIPHAQIIAL